MPPLLPEQHITLLLHNILSKLTTTLLSRGYPVENDFNVVTHFFTTAILPVLVAELVAVPGVVHSHTALTLAELFKTDQVLYLDDPCGACSEEDAETPPTVDVDNYCVALPSMSSVFHTVVNTFGVLGGLDAMYSQLSQSIRDVSTVGAGGQTFFNGVHALSAILHVCGKLTTVLTQPHAHALIVKVRVWLPLRVSVYFFLKLWPVFGRSVVRRRRRLLLAWLLNVPVISVRMMHSLS